MQTKNIGNAAENRALLFLLDQGLSLVEQNWYCRTGEIDLIMRENLDWVFVEVKFRKSTHYGGALASITPAKCKKLKSAAEHYILQHSIDAPCRFDAIICEGNEPIQWLKNIIS